MPEPVMTTRELNRAVLARQHLLERASLPLEIAVEAIGALQAQYAPAPPVALWSRMCGLTMDTYARALDERRLVTALLMRGTLHVVSAGQYWRTATAVHSLQDSVQTPTEKAAGIDASALHAHLVERSGAVQLSQGEVNAGLRDWLRQHGHDPEDPEVARIGRHTWRMVRFSNYLLNVQSRGAWGQSAPDAFVGAHAVLPSPGSLDGGEALTTLVRHHLGAFGPAASDDIASWIGQLRAPRLRTALAGLGSELIEFRDEAGRVLYDLASSPRPGAEVTAPVRYLPWFDSLLLAYAPRFRGRILPEAHRAAVIRTANLQVLPTFLVDGMVAGTWELADQRRVATLTVRAFERVTKRDRQDLTQEGERLVRFLRPGAASYAVTITNH